MLYIDRDELIKELSTMYKSPTSAEDFMTVGYDHAIADVVVTVHEQPAADVVEVVRCKNCKHLSDCRIAPEWNRICRLQGVGKSDDGYCDEGKRKEVEDGR